MCNQLAIILGNCELNNPSIPAIHKAANRAKDVALTAFAAMPTKCPNCGHEIELSSKPEGSSITFDLNEETLEVHDALMNYIDHRKIEALLELTTERFFDVAGDRDSWHGALWNLCLNAVAAVRKRPGDGECKIEIETSVSDGRATVTVKDNGCGMSVEDSANLWNRISEDWDAHGRGLGIVKATVEKMGGRIEVKSELGIGTIFTITLPLAPHL